MLSVVIPCYNDHASLELTLECLGHQIYSGSFEIIVVDSSAQEFAYTGPLTIRYLHQNTRVHAGEARNIGALAATGDVLIFMDAKVLPDPIAFEAISALPLENTIYSASLEISPLSTFWGELKHRIFFHEFQSRRDASERRNLPGTFLVMANDVFRKNDGFGNLERRQDTEYTVRMKRKGYRLVFEPKLRCELANTEDLRTLFRKVYLDGVGFAHEQSTGRTFLLPVIGLLKFSRIALRNVRWRRDLMSIALFVPTIGMSLVWIVGGVSSAFGKKRTPPS